MKVFVLIQKKKKKENKIWEIDWWKGRGKLRSQGLDLCLFQDTPGRRRSWWRDGNSICSVLGMDDTGDRRESVGHTVFCTGDWCPCLC